MATNEFGIFSDIGIPPESTGPRIHSLIRHEISYSNGTVTFLEGDVIIGDVSGATGTIIRVNELSATPNSTGTITVDLDDVSPAVDFTTGEAATISGSVPGNITVSLDTRVYLNSTAMVGGNNPFNSQNVDKLGSAHVRFGEGSQQLDAFGLTRTSTPVIVSQFLFHYNENNVFMSNSLTGAATVTHLSDEAAVVLNATTASGDKAIKSSDEHFPYIPGQGRNITMTIQCGDLGKTNVVRRWGYFSENDGVFFELDDTTVNLVLRSSSTGSVLETRIPQDSWNGDHLDGLKDSSNISDFDLDVSKLNIYWIDLQWLGAGQVRAGVAGTDGTRIIAHRFGNANQNPRAYMSTGSLPVRLEIENTAAAGSDSSLKAVCMSVTNDGEPANGVVLDTIRPASWVGSSITGITTEVPIASFRSAATFSGLTNRISSTLDNVSAYIQTNTTIIRIYRDTTLTGSPSWGLATPNSPLEVDTAATGFTGGTLLSSEFYDIGAGISASSASFKSFTKFDGAVGVTYTITAEQVDATGNSDVRLGVSWTDRS